SFIGPFIVTLIISMVMLIMQFFWVYIDDLIGKGIEITVILELLFYVSASLIPLALPLSILLSSIMTIGNMAENNELNAFKSAGMSLFKILRPLTVVILIITAFTFYFANYVIPVANLKWHSLIFDIQNTKISAILTPGVYSKGIEGYAIKVDKGKDSFFEGIIIHDHSQSNELKTIRAEKGTLYKSVNGKYLFFELKNGYIMEELEIDNPVFEQIGKLRTFARSSRPCRRSTFRKATYKMDLTGFNLRRSNEKTFADKHEMLNVFQISDAVDSINYRGEQIMKSFLNSTKKENAFFLNKPLHNVSQNTSGIETKKAPKIPIVFSKLSPQEKQQAISLSQTKIRRKKTELQNQGEFFKGMNKDIDRYWIEFHRKFALTYAILVLFFIGAPLGAIVKKGGFGAPVVIAAILFMVYFVLISIGENLAKTDVVSPFVGMWFAGLILTPIALFLSYSASYDIDLKERFSFWKRLNINFKK
ncbi:MAG: LptF/LptG family permease, partial [Bacteroidota bacterium]